MLKRESYRSSHAPLSTIAPLLDSEFDEVLNEGWTQNITRPTYRRDMPGCKMAEIIS